MTDQHADDLIRRLRGGYAENGRQSSALMREAAQALEDAARDNAHLRAEAERRSEMKAQALTRLDEVRQDLSVANAACLALRVEADGLAVQAAQARKTLEAIVNPGIGASRAHRILSDPDPAARLHAIQANAWQEVIDWLAQWHRNFDGAAVAGLAEAHKHFRTEEADR